MNFGKALEALKQGKRVVRQGWNGKNMFLFLVQGSEFKVNREPLSSIMGEGTVIQYHAHIDMYTAQGYVVPWLASQADLLSEDWEALDLQAYWQSKDAMQKYTIGDVVCPLQEPTRKMLIEVIDTTNGQLLCVWWDEKSYNFMRGSFSPTELKSFSELITDGVTDRVVGD